MPINRRTRGRAKSKRSRRRRRVTRRARRHIGGYIPNDLNTVIVARPGSPNDIDGVATPMSDSVFDEISNASPTEPA